MSSRYLVYFTLLVIVIAVFLGINSMKESYKLLPIQGAAKANIIPTFANWHDYTAPNRKFKVMLPSLPQNATQTVKDKKTDQLRNYDMYIAQKNDGTMFMINLITFPDSLDGKNGEDLMRTTINDLVQSNSENKLLSIKPEVFQNAQALDFKIQSQDNVIEGKTFTKDRTLYVLMMVAKDATHDPKDYDFFVHSFDMEQKQAQPTKAQPVQPQPAPAKAT